MITDLECAVCRWPFRDSGRRRWHQMTSLEYAEHALALDDLHEPMTRHELDALLRASFARATAMHKAASRP